MASQALRSSIVSRCAIATASAIASAISVSAFAIKSIFALVVELAIRRSPFGRCIEGFCLGLVISPGLDLDSTSSLRGRAPHSLPPHNAYGGHTAAEGAQVVRSSHIRWRDHVDTVARRNVGASHGALRELGTDPKLCSAYARA